MATYCISDIHGDIIRYHEMLELIEFNEDDQLYVIGDVIDRGRFGVEILLDIMEQPTVHMLMGNHEHTCYNGVVKHDRDAWDTWIRNGGAWTRKTLFYKEKGKFKDKIMSFLGELPTFVEIEVGENKFYLVHGAPADNTEDRLWFRIDEHEPKLADGVTIICGHTPTPFVTGKFFEPFVIWHGNGIIDIDCGCGTDFHCRQLGCLRLDDMAEFYVPCEGWDNPEPY